MVLVILYVLVDVEILNGSSFGVLGRSTELLPIYGESYTNIHSYSGWDCLPLGIWTPNCSAKALPFPVHIAEAVQCGVVACGGLVAI